MTSAKLSAHGSPLAEFKQRVERERALIALFQSGRPSSFGLGVARFYAFSVFVCYALVLSLSRAADRDAVAHGFVHAALIALSWGVGAPAALGAAQVLARQSDREALEALALQYRVSWRSLARARVLAMALRITRLIGIPALLLVALSVQSGDMLPWALAVASLVIVYSGSLGLGLALLAHFSAQLSVRHPRAMLLALLLGPLLISQAYSEFPNVIAFYSTLLDWLLARPR